MLSDIVSILSGPMWNYKLDSVILICPFQLRDSMIP